MDSYVELFQSLGGSLIMVAKGNRSSAVIDACKKYGGFYLGSIGGPAAILCRRKYQSVEMVDFEDLGHGSNQEDRVENMAAFHHHANKGMTSLTNSINIISRCLSRSFPVFNCVLPYELPVNVAIEAIYEIYLFELG